MSNAVFSPNRQYKLRFDSYEMRMSHWIDQPSLIRVQDDVCLFALNQDDWSAWEVRWLSDSTILLVMRKYPGLIDCTIELNVGTNEGQAVSRRASVAGSFSAVKSWVLGLT
ncbi:hypothetical protein [Spirosoma spitsbergense]|uniref:hypothetical protein n=1 Tax=Spirosoma spitsbergense TaxID=431554 RepID=UPI000369EB9C|nr:hypothetical protein [Spirosoma spitsbergense]